MSKAKSAAVSVRFEAEEISEQLKQDIQALLGESEKLIAEETGLVSKAETVEASTTVVQQRRDEVVDSLEALRRFAAALGRGSDLDVAIDLVKVEADGMVTAGHEAAAKFRKAAQDVWANKPELKALADVKRAIEAERAEAKAKADEASRAAQAQQKAKLAVQIAAERGPKFGQTLQAAGAIKKGAEVRTGVWQKIATATKDLEGQELADWAAGFVTSDLKDADLAGQVKDLILAEHARRRAEKKGKGAKGSGTKKLSRRDDGDDKVTAVVELTTETFGWDPNATAVTLADAARIS